MPAHGAYDRVCSCHAAGRQDTQARLSTSFHKALKVRPLLLDGGLGLELLRRDPQGRPPFEEWVYSRADVVEQSHAAWVAAGADVLETNTFLANELDLATDARAAEVPGSSHGRHVVPRSARELNRRAAELARSSGAAFVLGAIGPGRRLTRDVGASQRRRAYVPQIEGLLEGGVDGLLIETCTELEQVNAALAAVRDVDPAHAVWTGVSFSPSAALTLRGDVPLRDAASSIAPEVDLLSLNCCAGPDGLERALAELRHAGRPLGLYPNAGVPGPETSQLTPDAFGVAVAQLALRFDVALAGGCCGASPAHIAALRARWPEPDVMR